MNVITRFVSLVLIAAGFAGCSSMTGYPGYGEYPAYRYEPPIPRHHLNIETVPSRSYVATLNPDRTWQVNMAAPLVGPAALPVGAVPAYFGHNGIWMINGKAVPSRLVVVTNVPPALIGGYQTAMYQPADPLPAIGAETAAQLIVEMQARGNPCTAKEHTWNVSVGAFIGGLAAGIITGDARWVAIGALTGASGGSGEARMNCRAYTSMYLALQAKVDAAKARCKSTLSQTETDGVLRTVKTKECSAVEAVDFDRIDRVQSAPVSKAAPVRPHRETPARLRDADPDLPPK